MRDGFTFIAVVLDRSGSMESVRDDTIGGFNTFLRDQKNHPGEALMTLVQFDHEIDTVFEPKRLDLVPELTRETFVPRGNTALFNAIVFTIDSVGARLAAMDESERPSKVIVLVMTDGQENASSPANKARAPQLVQQQRDVYKWEFVFMGANQDAGLTAKALSFNPNNAQNYASNAEGTAQAFNNMSAGLRSYRSVGAAQVTNFFNPGESK